MVSPAAQGGAHVVRTPIDSTSAAKAVSLPADACALYSVIQVRQLAGRESAVAGSRATPGATTVAGLGQDSVNSDFGLNVSINDEYEVIFTVGHLQQNDQVKSVELARVVLDRLAG